MNSIHAGILLLLFISCNSRSEKVPQSEALDSALQKLARMTKDSVSLQKESDSLEVAYEYGAIVAARIIKLHSDIDNEYVYNDYDTLSKISFLQKDSTTNYYNNARKMIPAEETKVFDLVWSIKEIRDNEGGSGYHQIFMVMEQRPVDEGSGGFYRVSIKRMYEHRWGRVFPVGFVQVKLKPRQILIEITKTGNVVELGKWRKLPEEEKD